MKKIINNIKFKYILFKIFKIKIIEIIREKIKIYYNNNIKFIISINLVLKKIFIIIMLIILLYVFFLNSFDKSNEYYIKRDFIYIYNYFF